MTLVSSEQLYALIDMIINFTKVVRITPSISIHWLISFLAWMGASFGVLRFAIGEFIDG